MVLSNPSLAVQEPQLPDHAHEPASSDWLQEIPEVPPPPPPPPPPHTHTHAHTLSRITHKVALYSKHWLLAALT